MTDIQRYILEEWAEDYQQGRLGRRELLRRIAMMAGGAALAIPVLQSLGLSASPPEVAEAASGTAVITAQASGVTVPPNDPTLQASMISFSMDRGQGIGYLAQPRSGGPVPGILIIHENRGLLEHFKDVARRYAKAGYTALAVDLASHEGGTEKYADLAQVSAILGQTSPEQHVATMNAAVRHLQGVQSVRRDRIGATGFCFGGGMTWRLATQYAELRAAVPYYGSNPPIADVPKIKAAVLAMYGAQDTRLNQGIPAVRDALQAARVTHEIVIYPGADHGFFNDTGQRYSATAAREAWTRTVGWFDRYLKG
ncbi:MAG: dienelactone hydrolase family protein [bacterium]